MIFIRMEATKEIKSALLLMEAWSLSNLYSLPTQTVLTFSSVSCEPWLGIRSIMEIHVYAFYDPFGSRFSDDRFNYT